ncbi:MAG: CinA family protein [Longicatena sp.]
MHELIEILKQDKLSIGSCESLTAGLFASRIGDISGASSVFKGAVVTYATTCKIDVVHVDANIIEEYGVISAPCALDMARKARILLDVDICVSCSGNAGPSTLEGKASGLVYCAVASKENSEVFEFHFKGKRNEVRQSVVKEMINITKEFIQHKNG